MESDQETLAIETPGSALLAFDLPPTDRRCIADATLEVPVLAGRAQAEVWVSLETDLLDLPDGSSLGGSVVKPGSPSQLSPADDGRYVWDVTDLVAWSGEQQSDPVLVLVVKPRFNSAAPEAVVLDATESGNGASLHVVAMSGCAGMQP